MTRAEAVEEMLSAVQAAAAPAGWEPEEWAVSRTLSPGRGGSGAGCRPLYRLERLAGLDGAGALVLARASDPAASNSASVAQPVDQQGRHRLSRGIAMQVLPRQRLSRSISSAAREGA